MATLEQIGEALRRADAAGNVEDARKLAQAYASMKASQAAPKAVPAPVIVPSEPPEGAAPGSQAYADWALARVKAGKDVPQVSQHSEDFTRSPMGKFNAAYTGTVGSIPIAGPKLLEGAQALRGAIQGMTPEEVEQEQAIYREANPVASTAGAITGTVAPFVLASTVPVVSTILGVDVAAPMGVNMIAGAASQKAISHFDTMARGGNPEERIDLGGGVEVKPEDIAGGVGLVSPVVGKVVGKGAELLGEKVIGPAARTVHGWLNPEDAASTAISRAVSADARGGAAGLDAADELAAAANGQDLVNADRFGSATRGLARTAANTDPAAREALSEVAQQRFLTQNDRALNWVERNTGAPTDVNALRQTIDNAARGVNSAAYKTAYSQPAAQAIWTPEIEQLMQSQNFRDAIKAAIKTSNEEAALRGGKAIQNPFVFNQLTGGYTLRPGTQPSLEFWDHVQRALRRRASQVGRSGEFDFDAGQINRARQQLNAVLDEAVPEFATARGGAARWFGAEDALEAGQKFVSVGLDDLPEAKAAYAKFSGPEKKLFASGFASSLIRQIGDTKDTVDVITKVFKSPKARAQIELALGPKAAAELEPFLRVENAMQLTKQAIQGGSTTAAQLASMGVLGGVGGGIMGSGSINPMTWNPTHIATGAGLLTMGRLGARQMGLSVDQKVMQEVARLLSSNDPKLIEKAVQNAARSPKSADAIKAIEYGLSTLVRGAGLGAAASATEGTTQ